MTEEGISVLNGGLNGALQSKDSLELLPHGVPN